MKQKLRKVLDSEHIKKIIYVDDAFELNKDEVLEHLSAADKIVNELEGWRVGAPLEQEFERWWNEANEKSRFELADKLGVTTPVNKLSEIFLNFPLEQLTPLKFKEQYADCKWEELSETNRIILLMDKDLKLDDGRNGEVFLERFQDIPWVYCALFSQTFTMDQEMDEWKQASGCYPLAKQRVETTENFLEGIRNILWIKHINCIREDMNIYFDEAIKNVFEHAEKCDPYSFNHAVMESSKKEGCWEYETLLRLYLLQLESELRTITMDNFPKLQNSIQSLRNINEIATPQQLVGQYLKDLRKAEIFENGEYLNKIHAPIDNGDIFEISGKNYILLFQSCNLALRKNGKRKTNMGYVLPLSEEDPKEKSNEVFVEYLNYREDNKLYKIKLSEACPINISVLDLTSFSESGEARIDCSPESEIDSKCQPNLMSRYSVVHKEFEEVLRLLEGVKEDMKDTMKSHIKKFYLAEPTINKETLTFPIKRKCRYRAPYAQVLLQHLNAYLSRVGFYHDFSQK